eukprot:CAMPEP_0113506208 /NCGR_PEP_ID=MMETSP0014_2-20120614/35777_1 /TAXON_ID=2857 /ORGANISM="Nitzschia sp." /LENGTH=553 /DNA_ID=CAMNT_0000401671 /DNA_START=284 /DNA_END=1945 /DNA_ORIENTATION=- /assembly_acc=CAM_ASM_000159
MAGDADAVNERLAGLVNLLQVVGIDGVDSNAASKTQQQQGGGGGGGGENQILDLIRKLQQAQADSPEILAALQSPELRALATLAAAQQHVQQNQQPNSNAGGGGKKSIDDVMDDDDDNYPKIGPGYSDDISVVSDMTTPTVMTKQNVADEEQYAEVNGGPGALPPAHIGMTGVPANKNAQQPARPTNIFAGGAVGPGGHHGHQPGMMRGGVNKPNHLAGGPKTKNRVGQGKPRNAIAAHTAKPHPGGAAAQRRLNYQQAMQKLQTTPSSSQAAGGAPATAASRGPTTNSAAAAHAYQEPPSAAPMASAVGGTPEKSYMDNFSPKRPKSFMTPTSPTPSQNPMEFPSLVGDTPGSLGSGDSSSKKKKSKSKSLLSRKSKKDKSLAAQEESDFDFEGTDPIRAPPTPTESDGGLGGGGGGGGGRGKKKVSAGSNRTTSTTANSSNNSAGDVDWARGGGGWPAFDNSGGGTSGSSGELFGDTGDNFFPTDAFGNDDDNVFQSPSTKSKSKVGSSRKGHGSSSGSHEGRRKTSKSKKDGDSKKDKDKKKKRRSELAM